MNAFLSFAAGKIRACLIFILAAAVLSLGLLVASEAKAATAVTDRAVNLRTGPSTRYPAIETIPRGEYVEVYSCLDTGSWCDVEWDGVQGWVFARYLIYVGAEYRDVPIYDVFRFGGIEIYRGTPIIYPRHYRKHRQRKHVAPPPRVPRPPKVPIVRPRDPRDIDMPIRPGPRTPIIRPETPPIIGSPPPGPVPRDIDVPVRPGPRAPIIRPETPPIIGSPPPGPDPRVWEHDEVQPPLPPTPRTRTR